MSCLSCTSNISDFNHNCTIHSACFSKRLWSPSKCLQCSELFEKADNLDVLSIDRLSRLSRKFSNLTRISGYNKTIFESKFEYSNFFRNFLEVTCQAKPVFNFSKENPSDNSISSLSKSLSNPDNILTSKSDQTISLFNSSTCSGFPIQTRSSFLDTNEESLMVNLEVVSDLLTCSEQVVIESSLSDHIKDTMNSTNSSQVQSRGEQNLEASSNLPVSTNYNFAPMPPVVPPSQVILSNRPHNFSDNHFSVNTLNTVPGIKAYPYYSRMNCETSPLIEMRHSNPNPDCGSVQTEQPPSCDFTLSNQDLRRNVPYQNHPLSEDSNLRPA